MKAASQRQVSEDADVLIDSLSLQQVNPHNEPKVGLTLPSVVCKLLDLEASNVDPLRTLTHLAYDRCPVGCFAYIMIHDCEDVWEELNGLI